MTKALEHSDDPTANRQDHHIKIFSTTTDHRKSQHHVKFGAYAKSLVKKLCAVNPNEATEDFDYAPSQFVDTTTENIDLKMDEPSLLAGSTNVTKLMELERSI
jgi:hypothetical protein